MAFGGLTASDFFASWRARDGALSLSEVEEWIARRNATVAVDIKKIPLSECEGWSFVEEEGCIRNREGTFFKVAAMRAIGAGGFKSEQPILLQREIGYLGILCQHINGVLHFLMQAKIEPGNVNCVQISPTIQATKSNFTQAHNGAAPRYLEWFRDVNPRDVVVDLLQSEQGSRFLEKRNRNIMVYVNKSVEVLPSHCWMTLGQIAHFMQLDNMVNMDARTVLSCIPYHELPIGDIALWPDSDLVPLRPDWDQCARAHLVLNDEKMFSAVEREVVGLRSLDSWAITDSDVHCLSDYPYRVIFCDIDIEGREVRHWCQPLFEAQGQALFGLLGRRSTAGLEFLVKAAPELGAFDGVELGPTVQREAHAIGELNAVEQFFLSLLDGEKPVIDVLQSEEGGRFYHEENRNVIIIADDLNDYNPFGYLWCNFMTLALLCKERCVNIQLRNVLSLLGVVFSRA